MRTVELTAGDSACTSASGASSPSNISSQVDDKMSEEASRLSEQKSKTVKGILVVHVYLPICAYIFYSDLILHLHNDYDFARESN